MLKLAFLARVVKVFTYDIAFLNVSVFVYFNVVFICMTVIFVPHFKAPIHTSTYYLKLVLIIRIMYVNTVLLPLLLFQFRFFCFLFVFGPILCVFMHLYLVSLIKGFMILVL